MNGRRVVVDASAMVDLLVGSPLGEAVRRRLEDHELHVPAHFDAEVISALGRLHRAGGLSADDVKSRLAGMVGAPIRRHELTPLLDGAWELRHRVRLVAGLYVALAARIDAPLLTTDAALAAAVPAAELVSAS